MAIDPFDQRTLIATVNDPSFEAPQQYILSRFYGAPEATGSTTFDILRSSGGRRRLASFTASGRPGRVVKRHRDDVISTHKFPIIREKMPITAAQLLAMQDVMNVYTSQKMSVADRQAKEEDGVLLDMRSRVDRREEFMAIQELTTGKIEYEGEDTAFRYDFQINSKFFPVLTGGDKWSESTAKIFRNLKAWVRLMNQTTRSSGVTVICGSAVGDTLQEN